MSDVSGYLWLIPVLPLAACVITALFGPRLLRQRSHWPCVIALAGSFVVSVLVAHAVATAPDERPREIAAYYPWIEAGTVDVGLSLRADALSATMVVMVTFIAFFIAIYSSGYMHGDQGYARFFAEISLFVFMMTLLVLADNFVLLYAGWEGVGLCSYLLIGFWFTKPSAADAARKAFLVTRIGDVGLLVGIFLLWFTFGHHLDFQTVLSPTHIAAADHRLVVGACFLLFCGAVGKSAQFPLHTWLPDAMEGPSPVSALIHAATMVTAGVYLVARCTPLFMTAPQATVVVASIGGFTALLAALIALTQTDLKRVLAYSTMSQLGYMFLALGSAVRLREHSLVVLGVTAAMFHLFTHAFFKALLFLSAGSVMHAMGNVIDMRRFSGLRKVMPVTHWTFLSGAVALAGLPIFSGFWSKDEILGVAYGAHAAPSYGAIYFLLWLIGMVTAGLTAFYTFRAYFLTFHGELRVPPEAEAHHHGEAAPEAGPHHHGPVEVGYAAHPETAHAPRASYESPPVMFVPLIVLAVFALAVGVVVGPTGLFAHFLDRAPTLPPAEAAAHGLDWGMMALSTVVALAGLGLAWLMYVRRTDLPARVTSAAQGLYQLARSKFHFDELYDAFIVRPLLGLALFCRIFDLYVLDGIVDLLGHVPRLIGARFRPVQNGLVQFYALAMILGLTVFLIALVSRLP